MDIQKVAQAITYLRKRAGFTQKDLADRIGISDKAVSKWERGLGLPDVAYLRKLSILLDTDTDSLLAGDVIHHNAAWQGLLVLEDSESGIGLDSIVYDKPLCYILLSYYLLVGIRNINIVCNKKDTEYLKGEFGDGECLGIKLKYRDVNSERSIRREDYENCENVMIIFGRELLYGVDQTRFFQRAMFNTDRISIMALPKGNRLSSQTLCFDSDRKRINQDLEYDDVQYTQYKYSDIPIIFAPKEAMDKIIKDGRFSAEGLIEGKDIYIEVLDRGFVELDIETPEDLQEASEFIRIIQKRCGMNVYCIEEVAWRRGMLDSEKINNRLNRIKEGDYKNYVAELFNKNI